MRQFCASRLSPPSSSSSSVPSPQASCLTAAPAACLDLILHTFPAPQLAEKKMRTCGRISKEKKRNIANNWPLRVGRRLWEDVCLCIRECVDGVWVCWPLALVRAAQWESKVVETKTNYHPV